MCKTATATGLSSLFTAVCLREWLTHHTYVATYGIDGLQGELLARSVLDLEDALKTNRNISNSVTDL